MTEGGREMQCKYKIIAIVVGIFLSLCVLQMGYNNIRLGKEIYFEAGEVAILSSQLSESIGYLQKAFSDSDEININMTHSFEQAVVEAKFDFGYENMPFLDNVRLKWGRRFDDLYHHKVVNKSAEDIKKIFVEEADEMTDLKEKLENMTQCLMTFREKYENMSVIERCFVSWKNERKLLGDKVGVP